jgi:hypothetical protein
LAGGWRCAARKNDPSRGDMTQTLHETGEWEQRAVERGMDRAESGDEANETCAVLCFCLDLEALMTEGLVSEEWWIPVEDLVGVEGVGRTEQVRPVRQ